jgi:hypothetical protein
MSILFKIKKRIRKMKNKRLLHKYNITKANGDPVDLDAEYFVLRLDENQKDKEHFIACRKAIITYANEIENYLPELSKDLKEKYKI